VGTDLVAKDIVVKPKMDIPKDQLMSVKELEKLVAQGPEKGGYTLVDSRPGIKFKAGHIPTSISIPFPMMKKMKDKLPKDKNELLIFYCEGMR
jgi:rhodanese-related sulfurtransferase